MDVIAEIRRRHRISKESISSIARSLNLSRPTVRRHLQTETEPVYQRRHQPLPQLGQYQQTLESWLDVERHLPRAQRRSARRLFEGLQAEGYRGAYDSVQRFVKAWKAKAVGASSQQAFVPLIFAPGEVCQFDWSHEQVELAGVMQTIKVAHFRLAHSRQMFLAAYPRETQEMVFDAHDHRTARPHYPSLRHSGNRQRFLPLQTTQESTEIGLSNWKDLDAGTWKLFDAV